MSILYNPNPNLDGMVAARLMHRSRSGRVLARWLLALLGITIIVLFLPWRQTIRGNGKVTAFNPADRPQTANATIDGRIEEWFVQEGQLVQAGDSLIRISEVKDKFFDPSLLVRMNTQLVAKKDAAIAYELKIRALGDQIDALTVGRTLSLEKAQNKMRQASFKVSADSASVEAARLQVIVADTQFKRTQVLFEKGLKSLTDLEQKRVKLQETQAKWTESQNKLLTSTNERINAQIELGSLSAEYAEKIAKAVSDRSSAMAYLNDLQATIAKMENEVSSVEVRQGYYIIKAPQTGYVVKALKSGKGEMVKAGDPVVTVMPTQPDKAVELYVNAYDLPLLKVGDRVRLQFDGWPALQFSGWPGASFGTFGGQVAVIDYVATEKNAFRVLVKPDPAEEAWPDQLRVGSGAIGWAMLARVPVWYEIWRQMNGFPPKFYENFHGSPLEPEVNKKDKVSDEKEEEK